MIYHLFIIIVQVCQKRDHLYIGFANQTIWNLWHWYLSVMVADDLIDQSEMNYTHFVQMVMLHFGTVTGLHTRRLWPSQGYSDKWFNHT